MVLGGRKRTREGGVARSPREVVHSNRAKSIFLLPTEEALMISFLGDSLLR